MKLDAQIPFWKIWNTKMYCQLVECMELLDDEGKKLLREWEERAAKGVGLPCLMDDYAKEPTLTRKGEQMI